MFIAIKYLSADICVIIAVLDGRDKIILFYRGETDGDRDTKHAKKSGRIL